MNHANSDENNTKSLQDLVEQSCPQRSCSKLVLKLAGLALEEVWGPLGRLLGVTWPAFGRSWAALGLSWALLGRLLGASWALLGVSGLVWDVFWVHFGSQGRPGPRFGRVWGGFGKDLGRDLGGFWELLDRSGADSGHIRGRFGIAGAIDTIGTPALTREASRYAGVPPMAWLRELFRFGHVNPEVHLPT